MLESNYQKTLNILTRTLHYNFHIYQEKLSNIQLVDSKVVSFCNAANLITSVDVRQMLSINY